MPHRITKNARAYHHGDLKNALLDTALQQIAAHGARQLSLREVARATGVSHASTYRHFPNKEHVLATIAEQGFRALSQAMRAAIDSSHPADPLAMLQAAGVAYVNFGVSHPQHMLVMFGDAIASHAPYPDLLEAGKDAYEVLAAVVRAGLSGGQIRAENERVVIVAAWALVHGLASLITSGQIRSEDAKPVPHQALAADVARLMQMGLAIERADPSLRRAHRPEKKSAKTR